MKRLLLLLSFLCAVPAFSAYQYDNVFQVEGGKLNVMQSANIVLNFHDIAWQTDPITNWDSITVVSSSGQNNTFDITGNSVSIGNVSQGDTLQFWLSRAGNDFYAFDHFWTNGWDSQAGVPEYFGFGGNWGPNGGSYSSFEFQVGKGSAPSGQPLPGVLASLLIGGAGGGFLAWRKKRSKN